jgi:outer membrane protein TolC
MQSLSIIILSSLLLLSGCKVDQQAEVALYRKVLDAQLPRVPDFSPDESLTLPRALALANQTSEDLAVRGEDYVQALINKNRAVAAFLPTVSFQPGFTIEERGTGLGSTNAGPSSTGILVENGSNVVGATAGGGVFRDSGSTSHRFEAPVVGAMNVFRGFGDVANLKAAEAEIARRRELLLDLQATVLLNVAQVYYQVLRSERSAGVLQNNLQVQEARLSDVEQQFKNGLAIRLSVAQTRAQVDATRATFIQAQSDVRNGRSTLALLIGAPAVNGPLSDELVVPAEHASVHNFEERALANREDLRAAAAGIAVARQDVQAAFAQYYPSVSLNVTGFLYREFFADSTKWSSILAANIPIFSAGIIEADVRSAWSRLRQAALNESAIRRTVLHDVQIAHENLVTSDRRIHELADEVQAAEEALQQARNAFANNLAINLDVLQAQSQLLDAQLQLTSAQFDRSVFYLDLLRAAGLLNKPQALAIPTTRPATMPTTLPATMPIR